MIIRSEQMNVMQEAAEDKFVQRLAVHLRENYPEAVVRLPKKESTVSELPDETLLSLVRKTIKRARSYGLTFESSISAFSAVMFEVAPNFDEHNMSQLCLKDKNIDPNKRLDEVLKLLTEDHWEKIRNDYDVNAWKSTVEETEESEDIEKEENSKNIAFAETVMNVENTEKPKTSGDANNLDLDKTMMPPANMGKPKETTNINDISFDETMVDLGKAKKVQKLPKEEDFDLDKTVMNFDPEKEK